MASGSASRSRGRRPWWWIYGLCAGAVLAALAFVSRIALDLERETLCAAEQARRQDRQRTALWRLDSYLLPILAREGARPYFEYLAYYPQERGYTRFLSPIEKGEVLIPSPLLSAEPEHLRLHFQVDSKGAFSSPQVPEGNLLDLAQATCPSAEAVPQTRAALARVVELVPLEAVRAAVARAEEAERTLPGRELAPHPLAEVLPQTRTETGDPVEWAARQRGAYKAKQDAAKDAEVQNELAAPLASDAPAEIVAVGSLVPMWLGAATPELFFFRRVTVGASELLQGVWIDWPGLEAALLAEVSELVPGAKLEPVRESKATFEPGAGNSLATIPVRLVTPPVAPSPAPGAGGFTMARTTLAMAWGAVLAALLGGAGLLFLSLRLAERRSRFASAVTHELRTPLTTFRMYSEMLAEGMVREPEQRRVYLETLKEQSGRLATLVENVLAYARLEDGRAVLRRERTAVADLLARHRPLLERRAQEAEMRLETTVDEGADGCALVTDAEAIGQVLFNLVDNACKYARDAADRRIECRARRTGREVEIRVSDHGPGVPEPAARQLFRPFERGPRNGDPTPGVGLGLALARGLARDLGGDLSLEPTAGGGASFVLRLPLAA